MNDHIDNIMDCFDFRKVHDTMVLLNWQWTPIGGVPEEWQIRQEARRLLIYAYSNAESTKETSCVGTGGLRAEATFYEGKFEGLRLMFVLTEWDTYED